MRQIKRAGGLAAALAGAFALLLGGLAAPAWAGGSDSPPPYMLTPDGIHLSEPLVDGDHLNVRRSDGEEINIHIEAKCADRDDAECAGKPGRDARWLGATLIPWSAFGVDGDVCAVWVQHARTGYHYGEQGEPPYCPGAPDPDPTPEPEPTVDKWDLTIAVTCEAVTFSHLRFKQSFDPEYRVDVNGEQGERVPYTWGETVTIPAPDAEVSTTWEVRIFAKNPDLSGAYQQIGARKVFSEDCEPAPEPEPEPTPIPDPEPTPSPEPEPSPEPSPDPTPTPTPDPRDEEPRNPDPDPEPKREREVLFKHKTCDGVFERYVLWEYPVDGGEPIVIEHSDEKVRDLTDKEAERLGCTETPPPPKEEPKEEVPELAVTGVNPLVAIFAALGMAGTGAAMLVARNRKKSGLR